MSADFQIKLNQLKEKQMTLHEEAESLGIKPPVLQTYTRQEGKVTIIAHTPESEKAWCDYLTAITQAKIARAS